jgi:hypothetical protein
MTRFTDVLDAAKRLSADDQQHLITELRFVLLKRGLKIPQDDEYELPQDFSEELTRAFNEAQREALQHEAP